MKHSMRIRHRIGLLATVFACLLGIFLPGDHAFAQTQCTDQEMPTGGLTEIHAIACTTDELSDNRMAESNVSIRTATAETTGETEPVYAEDCYHSTHGYEVLNEAEKEVYNALKTSAHTFYTEDTDAPEITYAGGAMHYFSAVDNPNYALDSESIVKVLSMFRNDNPLYFFVGNYLLYSTITISGQTYITQFYISCVDDYADGDLRQEKIQAIETGIAQAEQAMVGYTTSLEKTRAAHDWIRDNNTYQYTETDEADDTVISHTILGIFDASYRYGVCEGYAKAFQLLLNAANVPNFYVTGHGNTALHAWNTAKMDDGFYYYFDVTWNDTARTDDYFAAGQTDFFEEHTPFTSEGEAWQYLYDTPDVPDASYQPETAIPYTDGNFTYCLYDTYAVLTSYTGQDEVLVVPDSANGLPVTQIKGAFAGNTSLQSVYLPESIQTLSYSSRSDSDVGAFEGCTRLEYIQMPTRLHRIEYRTFYQCEKLPSCILPSTVQQLGAYALENCDSLALLVVYSKTCSFLSASSITASATLYGYENSTTHFYADAFERTFYLLSDEEDTTTTISNITTTKATETSAILSETTEDSSTDTTIVSNSLPVTSSTATLPISESTTIASSTLSEKSVSYPITYGDIDRDGVCEINDLVLMHHYLIGNIHFSDAQKASMDCYYDGQINTKDSVSYMRYLTGLLSTLPIQPAA